MEVKEVKIQVPKGYEIDKENSTFECIKFKKKKVEVHTWKDIKMYEGYVIDKESFIVRAIGTDILSDQNIFHSERYTKAALALAQISQLMPYYGGEITNKEWNNSVLPKYVIYRVFNKYKVDKVYHTFDILAFHTKEQRDKFLSFPENVQLVKDLLMID